jgi:hypothetical protein
MESIVVLFLHIIIAAIVFSLLLWFVNLVTSLPILVEPVKSLVRVLLIGLLVLFAISFLLGDLGMWGTWGWGYHRRW